jgi:AhpD family alkylhydroperoxidase
MSQKSSVEENVSLDSAVDGAHARFHDEAPPRVRDRNRQLGKRKDIQSLALLSKKTTEIYQEFYKEIFKAGAIDRRTKELIAIAAASISGCEGCLVGHLRKARALGASEEEIKEAVAVAFAVNAATVVDRTDVAQALAKKMSEIEAQSPQVKE